MGRTAKQAEFQITEIVYGGESKGENQNAAFLAMAAAAIRVVEKEQDLPSKESTEKKSSNPLERT